MDKHMDGAKQQASNYVDMSVSAPLRYVTKPINWILLRCLFILPLVIIVGFPAVIVAFLLSAGDIAFLIMAVAFGIPVGIFFSWGISSMMLVALFGATCKAKSQAMVMLMIGIWPTCLVMSLTDTLPFLSIPHDYTIYVFFIMLIGAFVFGFWWVFKIPGDTENPVTLKIRAQSISFVAILIVSVLEMFYPYPETIIRNVVFDECEVEKHYSKYNKAGPQFVKTCRTRFEENGVERELYLSPGEDETLRIRHGLFDHYRSKFSD